MVKVNPGRVAAGVWITAAVAADLPVPADAEEAVEDAVVSATVTPTFRIG